MNPLPPVSLVIPAHDEEHALAACLTALLAEPVPFALQVVVSANGCSDRTADVAASFAGRAAELGVRLDVLDRAEAGKPGALNAADAVAVHAARAYLDADIVLSRGALTEVFTALAEPGVHLAAPRILVPLPTGRRLTDSFARVWATSPAVQEQVIGSGFYAVSATGRDRWTTFPAVIADDGFVRLQFDVSEQRVVRTASMLLSLPSSPREMLAVRVRWCRGNRELSRLFPELHQREHRPRRRARAAQHVLRHPGLWPHAPAALVVYVWGWSRAGREVGAGVWETATTAGVRAPTEPPA